MEKELLVLLRLGLGNSALEEEDLSALIMLSAERWSRLGDMARMQGVLGIMLDGVDKLENSQCGFIKELKANQKLKWIGEVLQIEHKNRQQIVVMNDLARKWKQKGCRVMVMKGQANGTFYPIPEHRNPGDIDCYLFEDYARGNEIAREVGAQVDDSWYKHSIIRYKNETFENHQYFVHTRDGKRGKKLNEELVEELKGQNLWFKNDDSQLTQYVHVPPVQWTAMFLTYHACAHFLSEGLRLKQILDWAMFLKKHQDDVDWDVYYAYCERNHLKVFADVMTSIAQKYLGVGNNNSIIASESPYATKILHSALYDEDYVFNSGKSGWANRWHLLRNMFHYRWKYDEIYQTSVWKQLWWYASGFVFKTE